MTEGRAAPLTREQWLAECCKLAKVYEDNMTKALDEIERKALALVNEVEGGNWLPHETDRIRNFATICRALEQHEAFRQEVSDAVERAVDDCGHDGLRKAYIHARFFHFIIPKPDPLVEAMADCGVDRFETWADQLRAAIEQRGGKIVWGEG